MAELCLFPEIESAWNFPELTLYGFEAKKSISTESLVHSPHLELNGELISFSMHTGSQNMNPQMATLLFVAPTSGHLTLLIDFGS